MEQLLITIINWVGIFTIAFILNCIDYERMRNIIINGSSDYIDGSLIQDQLNILHDENILIKGYIKEIITKIGIDNVIEDTTAKDNIECYKKFLETFCHN